MTDTAQAPLWGASYERMSPAVRARCMADDREFQQAQRAQEQERAARAEYLDQNRMRAAIEAAEQRGEFVSLAEIQRTGGASIGRTRAEFIADIAAQQDAEDARARARERAAGVEYDPVEHQALLLATNPTIGRTKAEAVAYYSALGDIQDIEAARRARRGLPTVDEEAAQRALLEKRRETIAARSRDHHVGVVAKGAAELAIVRDRERQWLAGEIGDQELREAARWSA